MPRTIKLATAAIVVLLATAVVGIIAYDTGRDEPQSRSLRYALRLDSRAPTVTRNARGDLNVNAQTVRYRAAATPTTVINLGRTRKGCTLARTLPPEAVCDLADAFPDVGLDGTVTFVGTGHDSNTRNTYTFELRN